MDILKTVTNGTLALGAAMTVFPHLGPELVDDNPEKLRANPDQLMGKVVNALAEHNIPFLSSDRNERVQQLATLLEPGQLILAGMVGKSVADAFFNRKADNEASSAQPDGKRAAKQFIKNIGQLATVGAAYFGAMLCVPKMDKLVLRNTVIRDEQGEVSAVSNDTLVGKAMHLVARHVGSGTPEENVRRIGEMVKPDHLVGAALLGTGAVLAGARSVMSR